MIGLIGDGSFQYSVQGLWTAVQHNLSVVYVVMRNHEYSILKSFADLEKELGLALESGTTTVVVVTTRPEKVHL